MTGIMDTMTITNDTHTHTGADLAWRKSSACATNACVEVADTSGAVHVRDATGATVTFGTGAWRQFITGIIAVTDDTPSRIS